MVRVLLTGASGQLGTEIQRLAPASWTLLTPGRDALNLAAPREISAKVAALAPDLILNAGAYTAVDKAEDDAELAFAINREAPAQFAQVAAARRIPFVHISTDYVFDGAKGSPYVESDQVNPLGVYGHSKAQGETDVLAAGADAAVLRTSWVFSAHRANFVKTMLRLGAERDVVRVVADQYGRPTPAHDLAQACVVMSERLLAGDRAMRGLFHFAGAGPTTWAGFAEAIFAEASKRGRQPVRIEHITTAEFPTRARRPANSVFDTGKIEALGLVPPPWTEGMRRCLETLL